MSRVAQKCGRAGGVCGRRAWGGCGASESRTCQNLLNARSIEQVFDGAACVRRFGNLLNAASILQVQSCVKRYWCARSEEDTCSMLRAFSRSRGRNVPASASRWSYSSSMPPLRLQPSPVVHMVRRGKAAASRFGGLPCSARDLSKRFWSYAGPFF